MPFLRSRVLRSAYEELAVVGSRWTSVLAMSASATEVGPPYVQAHLAHPSITIIPTLHVAGIKFYDRVLEYIELAVRRNKSTVVLLEGICDSDAAERQQMQEYADIMANAALQQTMLAKAAENNLYPPEVMREICRELDVPYDLLQSMESTVRLQECYLKPKLAATCGLHLRNNADLDMLEVQRLLETESARLASLGEELPSSIPVSQLGTFPVVRKQRERKVARIARDYCARWCEEEVDGEVIIPWGYFHSEAIIHYILEGNKTAAAASSSGSEGGNAASGSSLASAGIDEGRTADPAIAASPAPPRLVFVEADERVAKVPFYVPKELIEPVTSTEGKKG